LLISFIVYEYFAFPCYLGLFRRYVSAKDGFRKVSVCIKMHRIERVYSFDFAHKPLGGLGGLSGTPAGSIESLSW